MLNIVHWNCNSMLCEPQWSEIKSLLNSCSVDVCLLSETKIDVNIVHKPLVNIPHYNNFFFPYRRNSSGMAIFVKTSIRCTHFVEASLEEKEKSLLSKPSMIEWIYICHKSYSFLVGCIYIHPEANEADWQIISKSINIVITSKQPFFLLGDFNARHTLWQDSIENLNGKNVALLLQKFPELIILNMIYALGTPTHEGSNSIIDLGLSNAPRFIENFSIDKDIGLISSDHYPIKLSLNIFSSAYVQHNFEQSSPLNVKFEDKNIPLYHKMLNIFFHKRNDYTHTSFDKSSLLYNPLILFTKEKFINNWLESIGERLLLAGTLSFKSRKLSNHMHRMKLDERLKSLLQRYHRLSNHKRRHRDENSLSDFRACKNELREYLKLLRAQEFQKFVNKLESEKHNVVWNEWKKLNKQQHAFPFIKINNNILNEQQSLNNIAEYFARIFQVHESKSSSNAISTSTCSSEARIEEDYDIKTFFTMLNEAKQYKIDCFFSEKNVADACTDTNFNGIGFDGIPAYLLKNGNAALFHEIFEFFRMICEQNIFPEKWKIAKCIPVFKKKGSKFSPKNYRPICVTSVLARVYEYLINEKLYEYVKPHLTINQLGFKKKHSTLEHIFSLKNAIDFALLNKSFLPVAFLDFQKAFDSVNHDFLLYKLYCLHVDMALIRTIASFLSNRRFIVIYDNLKSVEMKAEAGVPQGCILPPLLFSCFINDLCHDVMSVVRLLYADDIALFADNLGMAGVEPLQNALNKAAAWSQRWGMKFSMEKSNVVIFANAHCKVSNTISFFLGHSKMEIVKSYKYLGISFDCDGTFKSHQTNILQKLMIIKHYILRLFHQNVFVSPFIIRNLLKAIILPAITYGIGIWTFASNFVKEIDSFLCTVLRMSIQGPSNISHNALFLEFHMLPLNYIKQYYMALFIVFLYKFNDEPNLAIMFRNNSIMQKKNISLDSRLAVPEKPRKKPLSHKAALAIMQRQQASQYKNVPPLENDILIPLPDDLKLFRRNDYINQLFIHYMTSIQNVSGSATSAKMFFEASNTHNYAQKPTYFYNVDKHLIFRFIRLRLDIAELKASVIGRHAQWLTQMMSCSLSVLVIVNLLKLDHMSY